jgi:predicted metal-binding membrane protein
MLVLLAFGLMNLVAMAVVAVAAYAETHLGRGPRVSRIAAAVPLACAAVVLVYPAFAARLHHALMMTMR